MKKKGKKKKIYAYNKAIMKDNREIRKNSLFMKKRGYILIIHKIYFTTGFKTIGTAN